MENIVFQIYLFIYLFVMYYNHNLWYTTLILPNLDTSFCGICVVYHANTSNLLQIMLN